MVISTRPFRRLLILNTAVRICSTCLAISTTVSFSSARTFSWKLSKALFRPDRTARLVD